MDAPPLTISRANHKSIWLVSPVLGLVVSVVADLSSAGVAAGSSSVGVGNGVFRSRRLDGEAHSLVDMAAGVVVIPDLFYCHLSYNGVSGKLPRYLAKVYNFMV